MKIYRMLTGPDDATFCRRITEALQKGWELHGSPTMTHTGNSIWVGQAIVKEIGDSYEPEKPLRDY